MIRCPIVFALLFLLPGYQASAQDDPTIPVTVSAIVLPDASEAAAYYDPVTGDVTIAIGDQFNISPVQGFSLRSTSGSFDAGDSNPDVPVFPADTGSLDTTTAGIGNLVVHGDFEVADVDFNLESGIHNIGSILPSNSDASEDTSTPEGFLDAFGEVLFDYNFRGGPEGGVSVPLNIVLPASVPEPGCLVMLSMAGVTLLARRRRSAIA